MMFELVLAEFATAKIYASRLSVRTTLMALTAARRHLLGRPLGFGCSPSPLSGALCTKTKPSHTTYHSGPVHAHAGTPEMCLRIHDSVCARSKCCSKTQAL